MKLYTLEAQFSCRYFIIHRVIGRLAFRGKFTLSPRLGLKVTCNIAVLLIRVAGGVQVYS